MHLSQSQPVEKSRQASPLHTARVDGGSVEIETVAWHSGEPFVLQHMGEHAVFEMSPAVAEHPTPLDAHFRRREQGHGSDRELGRRAGDDSSGRHERDWGERSHIASAPTKLSSPDDAKEEPDAVVADSVDERGAQRIQITGEAPSVII
jgi:hypothetical protein